MCPAATAALRAGNTDRAATQRREASSLLVLQTYRRSTVCQRYQEREREIMRKDTPECMCGFVTKKKTVQRNKRTHQLTSITKECLDLLAAGGERYTRRISSPLTMPFSFLDLSVS
jgi:hypothetical protein